MCVLHKVCSCGERTKHETKLRRKRGHMIANSCFFIVVSLLLGITKRHLTEIKVKREAVSTIETCGGVRFVIEVPYGV